MTRGVRAWARVVASFACLALSARIARAESSSTPAPASADGPAVKAPEASKKTKGTNRRRRPKRNIHEGDRDENGVVYTK